jgi:hypothetical protein
MRRTAVSPIMLFCLSWFCTGAYASTINAASCSSSAVQAAINSAATGDTVAVPGGSGSWSSAVDIPNTMAITVDGSAGCTITSSPAFTLEPSTIGESRITGFTFTGASSNPPNTDINVTSTTSTSAYRIDHNTFTSNSGSVFVAVSGNGPGLIDHNSFKGGGASEDIHNLGMGAGNNAGWIDNIVPGGSQMVFVEDNTFDNFNTTYINSGIESYYGARTVLRHNTFIFTQVDQHGTAGMVGTRWWEVYDNVFNIPSGQSQCCVAVFRGGTGVFWGNTRTGSGSLNSNPVDLYYETSTTWPGAWQVGSGINGDTDGHNSCSGPLNSAPAYIWGNDASFTPSNSGGQTCTGGGGGQCVQAGRDYIVSSSQPTSMSWQEASGDTCSTAYSYTPYTYPHPLQGTAPAPPTGLSAQIQ